MAAAKRLPCSQVLKIFGAAEAELQAALEQPAAKVSVTVDEEFPVYVLHVSGPKSAVALAAQFFRDALTAARIFSESEAVELEDVVHSALLENKLTVAVAESCTGGMIGDLLSRNAGASEYFQGGVVCYSNAAKSELLKIPADTISAHGAVSPVVAAAMAETVRELLRSDFGLSVTGIAGPGGGSFAKPVGTFYIGLSAPEGIQTLQFFYPDTRDRVRRFASYSALEVLRRCLLGIPLAGMLALQEISAAK